MENGNMILEQIFSVQNIVIYLVVVNLIGFFIMWLDKRKAQHARWRIKENTLFLVAAIRRRNWNDSRNVYI